MDAILTNPILIDILNMIGYVLLFMGVLLFPWLFAYIVVWLIVGENPTRFD